MSILEPGQVRRLQAARRRQSEALALADELLEVKQRLLEGKQRERALQEQITGLEITLLARDDNSAYQQVVLDLADRDRDLRILRRQVAAALASLQTYAKQDERRGVERSIAAETLRLLKEQIPREEAYDQHRR